MRIHRQAHSAATLSVSNPPLLNISSKDAMSACPIGPSQLADFLLTSSWLPSESVFRLLGADICEHDLRCSHDVEVTEELYLQHAEAVFLCGDWTGQEDWRNELVPFFWSGNYYRNF